jgi:membrane protease YdiL (CAAX protease family)
MESMSTQAIAVNGPRQATTVATWIGLLMSLFGMLAIRQVFRAFWPEPTVLSTVVRELSFWLLGAALIWLIRSAEGLPLNTIGLGTTKLWKSLAWGPAITVLCLLAAVMLAHLTGYGHRKSAFDRFPLWLVTWTVFRAGILEELFYRGYAIERLRSLGFNRWVAAGVPLLIFSIAHWTGGWANIAIAFVVGAILTAFFLWRKDLVANMMAHTLVDLIGNVLPRLFA